MLFMIEFNSNSGYIQNWILLNVFTVKQSEINKEKKIAYCFFSKSSSKCLGLAVNSPHEEVISHHDGNAFFSEVFGAGPCQGQDAGLDRLCPWCRMADPLLSCQMSAWKSLGEINRSPQEMLSLQPKIFFILMTFMTASLFYKPVSFPQNMMYFPNLVKLILSTWREKIPRDLSNFKVVWNQNSPGRESSRWWFMQMQAIIGRW